MDQVPGLDSADVSGVVSSLNGVPIVVERSMFLSSRNGSSRPDANRQPRAPQHCNELRRGATGPYFDTFVLIANPSGQVAVVDVTFVRPDGLAIVQRHEVGAYSRFTIWVDFAAPALAHTVGQVCSVVPLLYKKKGCGRCGNLASARDF